jgi:hypothetical protein
MRVVAYFDSVQQLERAGHDAEDAGWRVVGACAPAFNDKVLEAAHATESPVAIVALIGGAAGVISGVLLTVGTVREWPRLIVGGKPMIAVPSFLVITFELAILFAGVAGVWSFLMAARRARRAAHDACDESTSDSRLSLLFEPAAARTGHVNDLVRRIGATAWRRVPE